jgi:hypothetical protein
LSVARRYLDNGVRYDGRAGLFVDAVTAAVDDYTPIGSSPSRHILCALKG